MDEQPQVAEPATPAEPKGRLRIPLFVGAAIFAVAGIALGVYGFLQRADASDIQDDADAAGEELREFEQREDEAKDDLGELSDAGAGLADSFDELASASLRVSDAIGAELDAANRAIDRYNAGDPAGGQATFETDVEQAIADLEAAINERQAALAAAQTIVDTIRDEQ